MKIKNISKTTQGIETHTCIEYVDAGDTVDLDLTAYGMNCALKYDWWFVCDTEELQREQPEEVEAGVDNTQVDPTPDQPLTYIDGDSEAARDIKNPQVKIEYESPAERLSSEALKQQKDIIKMDKRRRRNDAVRIAKKMKRIKSVGI